MAKEIPGKEVPSSLLVSLSTKSLFDLFVQSLEVPPCHDPLPSPSLISTSLRVYKWLTSLTRGVHDDG